MEIDLELIKSKLSMAEAQAVATWHAKGKVGKRWLCFLGGLVVGVIAGGFLLH